MIEDFSPRQLLSILLSLALHGLVVFFLFYHSMHSVLRLTPQQQAINVSLVSPDLHLDPVNSLSPPAKMATPSQDLPSPASVVTAKSAMPLQDKAPISLPEQEKSQKHPAKNKLVAAKSASKPTERSQPVEPKHKTPLVNKAITKAENPFRPISDNKQMQPQSAPKISQHKADAALEGKPLRTTTIQPVYPERALALQQEGRVEVSFDVTDSGNVENIQIISAQPRNMFEHAVKMALRRWHYQSGMPARNQRVVIQFKLNDGTSID